VLALRQQKSKPILEKFKAWIDELLPGVTGGLIPRRIVDDTRI